MTVGRGITKSRAGLGRFAYNGLISYGPIRRGMTSCATNGRAELGDSQLGDSQCGTATMFTLMKYFLTVEKQKRDA